MRYEKGHKESTRRHIIDVASRRFRKDGVSASGLAGIMAEAGLTNGAFYPHFASKEELIRAALSDAMSQRNAELTRGYAIEGIEGAVREYLSKSHLVGSDEGCPSAALLPEIGRQSDPTRQAYQDGLMEYVRTLAAYLPDATPEITERRAMGIFGLMVGTLQIARAVKDPQLAENILEGGVDAALALVRQHSQAGGTVEP